MKRRILNNVDASNFEETVLRDNATTDVLRPGWFLDIAPYTLMVSMWFHIKPARAENIAIFVFIWALGCTRIFQLLSNRWWRMEFLAFECIRISRKWNISTALEQWRLELVQSKCIIGCQGGLYKRFVARGIVILGRHLVWLWIFSFFFEIYSQV